MDSERAVIVTIKRSERRGIVQFTLGGVFDPLPVDEDVVRTQLDSVDEIFSLAKSAGMVPVAHAPQHRADHKSRSFLGERAICQLREKVFDTKANVVLVDCELNPNQLRSIQLEMYGLLGTENPIRVLDRTQLILEIFAQHAASKEGQIQADLARLKYLLPRARRGLGLGTRNKSLGSREPAVENIYKRIKQLEKRLAEVRLTRSRQRRRRDESALSTIVLVGYTNAGKSTLFNAVTRAAAKTSRRLFETVDPTVRLIRLPSRRQALLVDTVGFIQDLPTAFVAGFRATIEEVKHASVIVHVSDISYPGRIEQDFHVLTVLRELGADSIPRIHVFSKIDLISPEALELLVTQSASDIVSTAYVSATRGIGMNDLLDRIDTKVEGDPLTRIRVCLPYSEPKLLSQVEARARVFSSSYIDQGVILDLQLPQSFARKLRQYTCDDADPVTG